MARNTTNRPTPPTTPAQPNIAKPARRNGQMPIIDKGTSFQRTVVIDTKTSTAVASFLVKPSDKHPWSFNMTTTFQFPKGADATTMAWAVRALRVDAQSRFRTAHFHKDADIRGKSDLAATWATHVVTAPDERAPADPVKAAKREAGAMATVIAKLRRDGKHKEADALAALA